MDPNCTGRYNELERRTGAYINELCKRVEELEHATLYSSAVGQTILAEVECSQLEISALQILLDKMFIPVNYKYRFYADMYLAIVRNGNCRLAAFCATLAPMSFDLLECAVQCALKSKNRAMLTLLAPMLIGSAAHNRELFARAVACLRDVGEQLGVGVNYSELMLPVQAQVKRRPVATPTMQVHAPKLSPPHPPNEQNDKPVVSKKKKKSVEVAVDLVKEFIADMYIEDANIPKHNRLTAKLMHSHYREWNERTNRSQEAFTLQKFSKILRAMQFDNMHGQNKRRSYCFRLHGSKSPEAFVDKNAEKEISLMDSSGSSEEVCDDDDFGSFVIDENEMTREGTSSEESNDDNQSESRSKQSIEEFKQSSLVTPAQNASTDAKQCSPKQSTDSKSPVNKKSPESSEKRKILHLVREDPDDPIEECETDSDDIPLLSSRKRARILVTNGHKKSAHNATVLIQ